MKPLSFWRGVALAALISVVGALLGTLLTPVLGTALTLRLIVLLAAGSYLLALLAHGEGRSGRVLALLGWLLMAGLLLVFNPTLLVWLLLQTLYLWLVRSLRSYQSLIPAAADALLSGVALAAAIVAALQSRSLLVSLWSYFLVQALTAFLLRQQAPATAQRANATDFDSAHRAAELALRRMAAG